MLLHFNEIQPLTESLFRAIGTMYVMGLGVERNINTARHWLNTACTKGDQHSCDMLRKL